MNTSGDAAESVVRMSLQGTEVALKLTGSAAKNIAALLYAIYKDKKQTKGKTTLTNMLKSGKELKVFTVKKDDLKISLKVIIFSYLFISIKSTAYGVFGKCRC